MMALWAAFKGSKLVVYIVAAAAAGLALMGWGHMKKREGRSEAIAEGRKKVVENVEKAKKSERDTADASPDERRKLRDRYTRK